MAEGITDNLNPDPEHSLVSKEKMSRALSMKEVINTPAPKAFTWDNARDLAIIVRDGLLMIVKGLERIFDLGKK